MGLCSGDAKKSVKIHGINILVDEHRKLLRKDYDSLFNDFLAVTRMENGSGEDVANPVFVARENFDQVNGSLRFLGKKTNFRNGEAPVKIYFLDDLFRALRGKAHEYLASVGKPMGEFRNVFIRTCFCSLVRGKN